MSDIKYPEVQFQITDADPNAFGIMGLAQKAARKAGLTKDQIEEYIEEATSGDYNNVISTTMKYFVTCGGDDDMTEEEADAEWDEHWAEQDSFQEEDDEEE